MCAKKKDFINDGKRFETQVKLVVTPNVCYCCNKPGDNTKLLADSNIFASPEAGRGNCLPYVQRLRRFPASQEDKYRDKK